MPRYIKAEDIRPYKGFFEKVDNVPKFYDWVETLPTADVVERKHGKWIMHIDDLFPAESTIECSECHHEQSLIIDDNFCPNCGAKMDRKETEGDNGRAEIH